MEALLSHSFDYLTSPSPPKIRKGLRQLEGLLAQLTLQAATSSAPEPSKALALKSNPPSAPLSTKPTSTPKPLSSLPQDPAFRTFYNLQNTFQYNVATRLISTLERLLGKSNNGANDLLIIAALDLVQGMLLLHPPSRELWGREVCMNLFLDLLDPNSCPAIHISTLQALTASLIDHPANTRLFEDLDGLLVVTSLFKSRQSSREVRTKGVEFLYFYLGAEERESQKREAKSAGNTEVLGGRGREVLSAFRKEEQANAAGRRESATVGGPVGGGGTTGFGDGALKIKSSEEKQAMLGRYMGNVQDLMDDMREAQAGGGLLSRGSVSPVRV
ncbi:uncharacterized protein HMPREF1541_11036 [Cyphellophora europaea CBS 101466]|uniref:Cell division control protein 14 n=1 Tax=Cyphellophora europaea (strain CBS 101466) TaxID=1220924 RepID=W2S5N5_CYPE1|nr:uncharacterized protein HMPREF1541_11036 [Cyphellophora europaea CBS 101466]ETN43905.1 hypothetical protein HMPREF1541_11036 [Cyphellophora europaea CBS 101466]